MNVKTKQGILVMLVFCIVLSIALALCFHFSIKSVLAVGGGSDYFITDQTDNETVEVDYYNDCYKDGNLPGNVIIALDRDIGASLTFTTSGRVNSIKWAVCIEKEDDTYKVTQSGSGFTAVGTSTGNGGTVDIPQDGYILFAKGDKWSTELQKLKVGDTVSALQKADGTVTAWNNELKQAVAVSGTNVLIDGKTTVYTEGYFSTVSGTAYSIVTAVADTESDDYIVTSKRMYASSSSAQDIIVPSGGIVLVSSGEIQAGSTYSYAKPFMQATKAGDTISIELSERSGVARYIRNTTQSTVIPVYFYNDFYKDSSNSSCIGNIPNNSVVYVDRTVLPDGNLEIRNGLGKNIVALVATPGDADQYTAAASVVPSNSDSSNYELTIPEGGYVLFARGFERDTLNAVADGDVLSGLFEKKGIDCSIAVLQSNGGYYVLDIPEKLNVRGGNFSVYSGTDVTLTENDGYILAAYDFEKNVYIVSECGKGTGSSMTVPSNSILLVQDTTLADKFKYSRPAVLNAVAGTVITYDGYEPQREQLPAVDLTINGYVVDGINPASAGYNMDGKIIVYTSTEMRERDAEYGSEINAPYRVMTYARSEAGVKNISVRMQKTQSGYKHIVAAITDGSEAAKIPYDGYIISIPAAASGYESLTGLQVGEELTLAGSDSAFRLPEYVLDNVTKNIRIELSGMNIDPDYSGFIVYYDEAFGAADPAKAWRQRVIVNAEGMIMGTHAYGSAVVPVTIPAGGFVLTANGATAGCAELNTFSVGDTLEFYNIHGETDATLASLSVNSDAVENFTPSRYHYYVYLEKGAAVPEVTYTASNANAQVSVQMPASLPGNCVIRVTAEDEATVFTYTIELLYIYSRDMGLASVTVGGSVWSSFDPAAEPNYYYIEKGEPIPDISAVATSEFATVTCEQASESTLRAVIRVVAEDTAYIKEYVIEFVEVDLSLSEILLDGEALTLSGEREYTVPIPAGTEMYPVVSATGTDLSAHISIVQAGGTRNRAVITVTNYGLSAEYTILFDLEGSAEEQPPEDSGTMPAWQIVLIVGGALAGVGIIVGLSMYFTKKRRGNKQ